MRIVLSNIGPDDAERVAQAIVSERLAACVNLLPVRSIYRWEGKVQNDAETTMLIKVSAAGVDALVAGLKELHPYDVPEIVVLEVDAAASLGAYVDWVRAETA